MAYVGLTEETTQVTVGGSKQPRVESFGFETTSYSADGNVGYEFGLNCDLGIGYELPMYSQDQFLVMRQRVFAFGGGRQFIQFTFYYVRLWVYLDLYVAKATVDHFMRYDIIEYSDFCNAAVWLLDVARASLLLQLDVNECVWGLLGVLTDSTEDCRWNTNYINQPVWDAMPWFDQMGGEIFKQDCLDSVPLYDA